MYLLLFLAIVFAVYINTFKNEFDKEDMGKATLFIILSGLTIMFVGIISNL
jgi:hypothetical protein